MLATKMQLAQIPLDLTFANVIQVSVVMERTALTSMNVIQCHVIPMRLVITVLDRTAVAVTMVLLGMVPPVKTKMNAYQMKTTVT